MSVYLCVLTRMNLDVQSRSVSRSLVIDTPSNWTSRFILIKTQWTKPFTWYQISCTCRNSQLELVNNRMNYWWSWEFYVCNLKRYACHVYYRIWGLFCSSVTLELHVLFTALFNYYLLTEREVCTSEILVRTERAKGVEVRAEKRKFHMCYL